MIVSALMADLGTNSQAKHSGIHIVEARVKSFRSLKLVSVIFDDLTLIIGENNSGKTSFLEALQTAIGQGYRANYEEDIFLGPDEKQPPKERRAIVDLLTRSRRLLYCSYPQIKMMPWGATRAQRKSEYLAIIGL